jgi:hypothetical protein
MRCPFAWIPDDNLIEIAQSFHRLHHFVNAHLSEKIIVRDVICSVVRSVKHAEFDFVDSLFVPYEKGYG